MKERGTMGNIDIFGPEDDAARIIRAIGEAFTEEELMIMCRRDGVKVFVGGGKKDAPGKYICKQEGVPIPTIKLTPDSRDDTVVHEFVHHLRAVDEDREGITSTPFPMNEEGELVESDIVEKYKYELLSVEESATVAETTARRRSVGGRSGYFSKIEGISSYHAYIHDRLLLTGSKDEETSKDRRGKEAVDAVSLLFDRTKISEARIFPEETNNRTAKESVKLMEKEELIKYQKKRCEKWTRF